MTLQVRGYTQLQRAFKKADRDIRLGFNDALKEAAEPVRADAESLAATEIRNINPGDPWSEMRVGVTTKLVYVVPKKRGTRKAGRRRPNLSPLLLGRALEPALERNTDEVAGRVNDLIGRMADDFNGR